MPTLTGDNRANVLTGSAGADVISGMGGADTIDGGDGDDVIYGHSLNDPGNIASAAVFTGLSTPVAAVAAPSDSGFLYLVEKDTGIIWRGDVATGQRTAFLDIPQGDFTRDGERGVLGLAFHPDYAANGRFFVFLTDAQGDLQVREYHRSAGNPAVADTGFTVVIDIPHPTNNNHNGGWIDFSPTDGFLYIATGDGGGGGDTPNNAQNLNVLLGKMLRIDVNGDAFPGDATRNYAIPASNPFVGVAGADEIWAYGLRNPFRNGFDPRNGDLYIGDVGQSAREEIDYRAAGAAAGANFGWRIMEGNLPFNPGPPGTPQPGDPSLVLPIFDYGRGIGTTVTGGEVYVGATTSFVGQYVFADFGSGRLFSLSVVNGASTDATDRTAQLTGAIPFSIVDFETDSAGALYAVGIGGTVWRLTPANGADDLADTLNGGAGDDRITGGLGADIITGGAGNDIIDGGSGADIAVFAGAIASRMLLAFNGVTAAIDVAGNDTDQLTNVETLQFTNGNVTPASAAAFAPFEYLATWGDLIGGYGANAAAAFQHYILHGAFEGRSLDGFNNYLYLASNPDVLATLGADANAAALHYVQSGYAAHRPTSGFNALEYIASNPDLVAGLHSNAAAGLTHYVEHGFSEGRATTTFDPYQYIASYPDLIAGFHGNAAGGLQHYLDHGFDEGRPADTFDALRYLASNLDLLAGFGHNETAAARHYVLHGFDKGRSLTAFDPYQYIASYADLITSIGLNADAATAHFVDVGFGQGRACDTFDASQYLANYPDLQAAFGTDLFAATLHYIQSGYFEGRTDDPIGP